MNAVTGQILAVSIVYVKVNGAKDSRIFMECNSHLDAINKLLQYIQVKRICSITTVAKSPTIFTDEFLAM